MIPTIQRAVLEGLLSSLSAGHCLNRGLYPALSQAQTSTLSFIRTISHEATIVPDEGQPSTIVPTSPDVAHASRSPKRQSPMTKKKYLCSKGTDGRHVHLLRYHQEAASYHGGIQQHADTLRVLRRYNYSLPALKGQVILARVLRVSSQRVHVDPGFHSITDLPRADIDISHVHKAAPGQALETRQSSDDLRVGDVVCVKVDALYTPYGDMQVEAVQQDPALKKLTLWRELVAAWQGKRPVFGRLLNQCPGGYAVGISGFVALLPYARATTATTMRIGELAPYYIDQLNEQQQLLVVRDCMFKQRR